MKLRVGSFTLLALLAFAPAHAAITFDGDKSNDHYALASANHPGAGAFTWMSRLRFNSFSVGVGRFVVLCKNANSAGGFLDFVIVAHDSLGKLTLAVYIGGVPFSSAITEARLSTATNYNIALAYGHGGTAELYVNGTEVASVSTPMSIAFDDMPMFGGSSTGHNLDGSFEAVKVWKAKLSQSEIQLEQSSITAVRTSNLWDTWRFTAYNSMSYTGAANSHGLTNESLGDVFLSSDLTPPASVAAHH